MGNRRIGVAVSDELGITAQPVLTLERKRSGKGTSRDDLRSLARLARRFSVAGIVVGNPVHLSGETSPQTARTQAFAADLGTLTGLPIHLWDERLTTKPATPASSTAVWWIRWRRHSSCNRSSTKGSSRFLPLNPDP